MAERGNTEHGNVEPTTQPVSGQMRRKPTEQQRKLYRAVTRARGISVLACATIMVLGCVLGLLLFARPDTSVVEKRTLTPFPEFSAERFATGEFFSDLSLWYADTYPAREPLVAANQALNRAHGIQPKVKLIGGNVAADQIGEATGSQAASAREWDAVDAPDSAPMQEAMEAQIMNGLYVANGAVYNLYYFYEPASAIYIEAVNTLAQNLEGDADVYSMLIPNGSAVLLDQEVRDALGASDQEQAIEYYYGRFADSVTPVDVFGALKPHASDYLFFRSDHHWTQLGAYWAYREFCETAGLEPVSMEGWEELDLAPFLGTFYAQTYDPALEANPDTVEARIPSATNAGVHLDQGTEEELDGFEVVHDVSGWDSSAMYACYAVGDEPLSRIDNPRLADGSSCLLLKDSYGNALVPELLGSYQTLWVIDYRYSSIDLPEFVREHGIGTVIVENNISIATAEPIARALLDQADGNKNSQLDWVGAEDEGASPKEAGSAASREGGDD